MSKMKKLIILIGILSLVKLEIAIADSVNVPMPIMPRVGIQGKIEYQTVTPEKKDDQVVQKEEVKSDSTPVTTSLLANPVVNLTVTKNQVNNDEPKKNEVQPAKSASIQSKLPEKTVNTQISSLEKHISYNDIDLKKIADEIKDDLQEENPANLGDLNILWQAAVAKSETIRFAILKLSNPEGDPQKKNVVKTMLTPLTSVAPLIGSGLGNAVAGNSSFLASGVLNSLLADDSLLNQQLSKVTDSDLVILAQEIDSMQQKLIDLYYNYYSAVKALNFTDKIVENRYKYYQATQNSSKEMLTLADVFYRESLDMQYKAREEVLTSRANLEQFVGNDALIEVDKKIKERLAGKPQ